MSDRKDVKDTKDMSYCDLVSKNIGNVYQAGIATKIMQHMGRIRNSSDVNQARRWVMELLQNARDVAYPDKPVKVKITLDENQLKFSHTGRPFRVKDILSIVNQVSSKVDDEETVGQFGTGFVTTFQLSEQVELEGLKELLIPIKDFYYPLGNADWYHAFSGYELQEEKVFSLEKLALCMSAYLVTKTNEKFRVSNYSFYASYYNELWEKAWLQMTACGSDREMYDLISQFCRGDIPAYQQCDMPLGESVWFNSYHGLLRKCIQKITNYAEVQQFGEQVLGKDTDVYQ